MALGAGRGVSTVAGGAVGGSVDGGVLNVELAARSALEPGVAGFALTEGLAQRPAGGPADVAGFAVGDLDGNQIGVRIVNRGARSARKGMTFETVRRQEDERAERPGPDGVTVKATGQTQGMMGSHDIGTSMTLLTNLDCLPPRCLRLHLTYDRQGNQGANSDPKSFPFVHLPSPLETYLYSIQTGW